MKIRKINDKLNYQGRIFIITRITDITYDLFDIETGEIFVRDIDFIERTI